VVLILDVDSDLHSSPDIGEVSAVLGAAYESFLYTRIERRAGRRGKVHRRALMIAVDMATEMTGEANGHGREALWRAVIAEFDRERAEIEADVLEHQGHIVVEHEWAAFLVWLRQVRVASQ